MAKPKKIDIYIIPVDGIDVKFTYSNNVISYHFEHEGKNYGNAINILQEGKKKSTIPDAIQGGGMLMLNAIESVKHVRENSTN